MSEIHKVREEAIRTLLTSIVGEYYASREGLEGTPERVSRMYDEIFGGYWIDTHGCLDTTFKEDQHNELVIVRNIEFYSHCEHHMVPFFGKAHIGYIPNGSVVGLSKIARLVDAYARRLQIQERMTRQIADTMETVLAPMGVMVVIEAEHLCMKMRGIKNPCADTVTSAVRGVFKDDAKAREEFLRLIGR